MFGDDPRKQATRRQFLELMREHYGFQDNGHFDVPYETGALSAIRSAPPQPRGTIVIFGGFDGYIEELFPMQHYFGRAGYDVVSFDGPGQGVALEDGHLAMTHEGHKPATAVLDHFHLDEVTLIAVSLGKCLAVRATAYKPRVRRVVADDRFTDYIEITLAQLKPAQRAELSMLLNMGADYIVNTVVERALKDSLVTEWGGPAENPRNRRQTPAEWLSQMRLYRTGDVSPLIEKDVLLLAGGRRPLRSAAPVLRPDPPADRAFVHQTRTGTRAHPDR